MTSAHRLKPRGKHDALIKTAAIWGAATLTLIGIIVTQSAETIKIGYQISDLNAVWQEKNFEHMRLVEKINGYTGMGKTDKFIERHFNLRRAEPAKIIFMDDTNASK
ncbi:MAG: hypothetical protein ABII20_07015 [Candidatus Omnitrophota bacterium]|nr:hypothetical protein [Candidatus Omnitrophota bacterium]MBU2528717.1 hypothetical protein [bacterium]MBU3929392.1 hypothetical protein [bacterium]MBU4123768.1 hypothetical protein [bacterium]